MEPKEDINSIDEMIKSEYLLQDSNEIKKIVKSWQRTRGGRFSIG